MLTYFKVFWTSLVSASLVNSSYRSKPTPDDNINPQSTTITQDQSLNTKTLRQEPSRVWFLKANFGNTRVIIFKGLFVWFCILTLPVCTRTMMLYINIVTAYPLLLLRLHDSIWLIPSRPIKASRIQPYSNVARKKCVVPRLPAPKVLRTVSRSHPMLCYIMVYYRRVPAEWKRGEQL